MSTARIAAALGLPATASTPQIVQAIGQIPSRPQYGNGQKDPRPNGWRS